MQRIIDIGLTLIVLYAIGMAIVALYLLQQGYVITVVKQIIK